MNTGNMHEESHLKWQHMKANAAKNKTANWEKISQSSAFN